MEPASDQTNAAAAPVKKHTKRVLLKAPILLLWMVGPFLSAGRFDWKRGWTCLAVWLGSVAAIEVVVRRYNPGLLAAREDLQHKNTKRFDKVILATFVPLAFMQPVIAGLDAVRYRWSSMPFEFVYPGTILFILAVVPLTWAMVVNPFAESSVRIQTDRGHRLITTGPYRVVRHPMYVGCILMFLAPPLIWGSVWALLPGVLIAALFILRTDLEDRTLRRELAGYKEFTARTRYKLLPGVW